MTRPTHPHRKIWDERISRKRLREQVAASEKARAERLAALKTITVTTEAPDAIRVEFNYNDEPDCVFDRLDAVLAFVERRAAEDDAIVRFGCQ